MEFNQPGKQLKESSWLQEPEHLIMEGIIDKLATLGNKMLMRIRGWCEVIKEQITWSIRDSSSSLILILVTLCSLLFCWTSHQSYVIFIRGISYVKNRHSKTTTGNKSFHKKIKNGKKDKLIKIYAYTENLKSGNIPTRWSFSRLLICWSSQQHIAPQLVREIIIVVLRLFDFIPWVTQSFLHPTETTTYWILRVCTNHSFNHLINSMSLL